MPSGSITIGFLVADINDAMARLNAQDMRMAGEFNEAKAGAFAWFEDPDGNQLYLCQLRAGYNEDSLKDRKSTRNHARIDVEPHVDAPFLSSHCSYGPGRANAIAGRASVAASQPR